MKFYTELLEFCWIIYFYPFVIINREWQDWVRQDIKKLPVVGCVVGTGVCAQNDHLKYRYLNWKIRNRLWQRISIVHLETMILYDLKTTLVVILLEVIWRANCFLWVLFNWPIIGVVEWHYVCYRCVKTSEILRNYFWIDFRFASGRCYLRSFLYLEWNVRGLFEQQKRRMVWQKRRMFVRQRWMLQVQPRTKIIES